MQNLTEQEVIDYARRWHNIPPEYAKNWFQYWNDRHWITTTGKLILNWRVKFDWWAFDNRNKLIASESSPTPAEMRRRELERQHEEREKQQRAYEAELADPEAQAEIAAIQERLLNQFH